MNTDLICDKFVTKVIGTDKFTFMNDSIHNIKILSNGLFEQRTVFKRKKYLNIFYFKIFLKSFKFSFTGSDRGSRDPYYVCGIVNNTFATNVRVERIVFKTESFKHHSEIIKNWRFGFRS